MYFLKYNKIYIHVLDNLKKKLNHVYISSLTGFTNQSS